MKYTGGSVMAAIVVLIMGIINLTKPELAWKLQHLLTVRDGEPTEYYLISTRISGVICIILSVGIMFFALTGRI